MQVNADPTMMEEDSQKIQDWYMRGSKYNSEIINFPLPRKLCHIKGLEYIQCFTW